MKNTAIIESIQLTREEKVERIAYHFKEIMQTLGLDLQEESLADTPRRVAQMYVNEIFSGLDAATFPSLSFIEEAAITSNKEMVITKARFVSFCEHHFVPMIGNAFVAYIPNKKVIGLSKVPRLIHFLAARPQLQERLTTQIADTMSRLLETEHVAVSLYAQHFCVIARGVKDEESMTTTSTLLGDFLSKPEKKQEFYDKVRLLYMHKQNEELV